MTKSENVAANAPPTQAAVEVDANIAGPMRIGFFILFLVFAVFGAWAALAPINAAAYAPGIVTVKSYKKTVQHLEGGIVSEIRAQNGDFVAAGEPLLVLDNTQSMAQLEMNNAQFAALKAMESRLIAERDKRDDVAYSEYSV